MPERLGNFLRFIRWAKGWYKSVPFPKHQNLSSRLPVLRDWQQISSPRYSSASVAGSVFLRSACSHCTNTTGTCKLTISHSLWSGENLSLLPVHEFELITDSLLKFFALYGPSLKRRQHFHSCKGVERSSQRLAEMQHQSWGYLQKHSILQGYQL